MHSEYSFGKIAQEIYAKIDPEGFSKLLDSDYMRIPFSAEDLLKIHKDNVLDFSV
jgi:hypothetical protein